MNKLETHISQLLIKEFGTINEKNINRYLKRRIFFISDDLCKMISSPIRHSEYQEDDSVFILSLLDLREKWGMILLNGKQQYAINMINDILFEVVYNGHNGIASAAKLRENVMNCLMEDLIENSTKEIRYVKPIIENEEVTFDTPIDKDSLREEMDKWNQQLKNEKNDILKNKLQRNIACASIILAATNDSNILVQEMNPSDSGRLYFKGLNLQNIPKKVRHAALGSYHLYDIRVCAFGVMAGIAMDYQNSLGIPVINQHHIYEYIRYKDKVRMDITKQVYPHTQSYKLEDIKKLKEYYNIKISLTAIGFGAKLNTASYWEDSNGKLQTTSLLKSMRNKEDLNKFLNCEEVKNLIKEFTDCTKSVLHRLDNDQEFAKEFSIKPKMTKGQKLAMVYQTMESIIMNQFISNIGYDKVLLSVHDGVYLKHGINLANEWTKLKVKYIYDMLYIQFDHEHQIRKNTNVDTNSETHSEFIKQEERIANMSRATYKSNWIVPIPQPVKKSQVMTPYGLMDEDVFVNFTT